jgi:hypothetical protein
VNNVAAKRSVNALERFGMCWVVRLRGLPPRIVRKVRLPSRKGRLIIAQHSSAGLLSIVLTGLFKQF